MGPEAPTRRSRAGLPLWSTAQGKQHITQRSRPAYPAPYHRYATFLHDEKHLMKYSSALSVSKKDLCLLVYRSTILLNLTSTTETKTQKLKNQKGALTYDLCNSRSTKNRKSYIIFNEKRFLPPKKLPCCCNVSLRKIHRLLPVTNIHFIEDLCIIHSML